MTRDTEVVGLIPCAGKAARISPLPCSKEVLPVGFRCMADGSSKVKVVSHYLLDQMRQGGVRRAFLILRKGKWDIPDYYGDGSSFGIDLAYLITRLPHGPAYTLDQAYPFIQGARIAFGFPDILFEPADAFTRALARLHETGASLVLVLCSVRDSRTHDMVRLDPGGRVLELVIKPEETDLRSGWILAVWTPDFTEFLHEHLQSAAAGTSEQPGTEVSVGAVIDAALRAGLVIQSVSFPEHSYLDIGTPEGLRLVSSGARVKQHHHLDEFLNPEQ